MKKIAITLSVIVFILGSCGRTAKKQAENGTQSLPIDDVYYTSAIRPGEKLKMDGLYTDTLEYVGYENRNKKDGEAYFIFKRKQEKFYLMPMCVECVLMDWRRGDLIEIQWNLHDTWVVIDGVGRSEIKEGVEQMTKITDKTKVSKKH